MCVTAGDRVTPLQLSIYCKLSCKVQQFHKFQNLSVIIEWHSMTFADINMYKKLFEF
jgi:hypothetical protein